MEKMITIPILIRHENSYSGNDSENVLDIITVEEEKVLRPVGSGLLFYLTRVICLDWVARLGTEPCNSGWFYHGDRMAH